MQLQIQITLLRGLSLAFILPGPSSQIPSIALAYMLIYEWLGHTPPRSPSRSNTQGKTPHHTASGCETDPIFWGLNPTCTLVHGLVKCRPDHRGLDSGLDSGLGFGVNPRLRRAVTDMLVSESET